MSGTRTARRGIPLAFLLAVLWLEASGAEWPQFHGPNRTNISTETGLLKKWPDGGPTLLWTAEGIGSGFSTVAIADGLIYTTGNIGKDTVITALGLDGKVQWTAKNGPAYKRAQPGTRSTPTLEEGRLYHMGADGDLACLDAKTGKPIWSLNILTKFQGRNIEWALAESLLIDGEKIFCKPGGQEAGVVALKKTTGETIWVCKDADDKPGYSSPILFEHQGVRGIVSLMSRSIVAVNADTGDLLWKIEHVCPFDENIFMPLFHDGRVFVSTRTTGSRLFKLGVDGKKVAAEELWHTTDMTNQHGAAVLVDGHLYGECHTGEPWACLELGTGKATYSGKGVGRASVTCADGLLYLLSFQGTMALVRPNPREFELISRFDIPKGGRGPVWAHPVVCGGRLYVRHDKFLYTYDARAK